MTDAPSLTDFLLARIAEDEGLAKSSPDRWGPNRRAERESAAKRRIVEAVTASRAYYWKADGTLQPAGLAILRALALPYADHPDYREKWRP